MSQSKEIVRALAKSAKQLLRDFRNGDLAAQHRINGALRAPEVTKLSLMQAQHVVATELGLESWDKLRNTPDEDLRARVSSQRKRRRLDRPTQKRVRYLIKKIGIDVPDLVLAQPINVLGLRRTTGGRSASLAVALRIAEHNAKVRRWSLDLGHYCVGIDNAQGKAAHRAFSEEGIPFAEQPSQWWNEALKFPDAYKSTYENICDLFGKPVV